MRLLKKLSMRLCKKIFLTTCILIPSSLLADYEIKISFESGFEFEAQRELLPTLQKERSRRGIERVIKEQEWIKDYSLTYIPFEKKIFISIKNRTPFFVLNKEYFYDKNQKQKLITNSNSYIKNLNWDNISDKIINVYKNNLNNKEIVSH